MRSDPLVTCAAALVARHPIAIALAWALVSIGAAAGAVVLIGPANLAPDFFAGTHAEQTQISRDATAVHLMLREAPNAFAAALARWESAPPSPPSPPAPPAAPALPLAPHHRRLDSARLTSCIAAMGFRDCSVDEVEGSIDVVPIDADDGTQRVALYEMRVRLPRRISLDFRLGFLGGVNVRIEAGTLLTFGNGTRDDNSTVALSTPLVASSISASGSDAAYSIGPHFGAADGTAYADGYGIVRGAVPSTSFALLFTSVAAASGAVATDFARAISTFEIVDRIDFTDTVDGTAFAVDFTVRAYSRLTRSRSRRWGAARRRRRPCSSSSRPTEGSGPARPSDSPGVH